MTAKRIPDKQGKNREPGVGYKRPPKATRFKPGQSGNPAGRPKSVTFSEACRKLLAEIENKDEQLTVAEELARAAILAAKLGSAQHLKEINDRVEGKAKQTIEIVGDARERLARALGVKPEELDAE